MTDYVQQPVLIPSTVSFIRGFDCISLFNKIRQTTILLIYVSNNITVRFKFNAYFELYFIKLLT